MSENPLSSKTDRAVGHWLDIVARRVGRRKALLDGLKAAAVVVAGVTVGTMPGRAVAHEGHPNCHYPDSKHCSELGKTCPSVGCPSGCVTCVREDGCPDCIYSSGYWATLHGVCGSGGYGFYLCYDCRCTGCERLCGCKSVCMCGGCRNRGDVEVEMRRILAAAGEPQRTAGRS